MTDAGGTNTLKQISNVGEYTLWELRNDSVTDGETIPFDGPANSPVKAEDQVMVVGALAETGEAQAADGTLTPPYDETAMHFTVTLNGLSDTPVKIWFYHIPQ